MKSLQRPVVLLFTLCFLLCRPVGSQSYSTSLRGIVSDASGSAIAGATVTLRNSESGVERGATTDASGEFQFLQLPAGKYILTVVAKGFANYELKDLALLVNTPATANVQLKVGSATESVTVTSEAPPLNMVDASLGNSFGETQVKQIPIEGRNVPDLLTLQPGVSYTGNRSDIDKQQDTRSGSVNGARSDQSNVTLDGADVNDQAGGAAFTSVLPVTLDSVEEFRVTTTNYNADQGSSSGAQVALVTKSGTNNLHGSLYEYNRTSATSANDYFIKQAQLNAGDSNQSLKLTRNIFGASVGGPIKKNRLFFFANFEGYRDSEAQSALRTIPTASLRDGVMQYACDDPTQCPGGTVQGLSGATYNVAAGNYALSPSQITGMDPQGLGPDSAVLAYMTSTYPLPNDTTVGDGLNTSGYRYAAPTYTTHNWYIAKLDYNLTADAKHRLSLSGALANSNSQGAAFLPGSLPELTTVNYNKGIIANYAATLSNTLINNFRYGYIRESNGFIGDSTQSWNLFRSIDQGITRSSEFQRPIHNFLNDVTWIHGRHTFQFGGMVSILRNPETNLNNSFSDGSTNASWLDTAGFANTGSQFDPASNGYPAVAGSFTNSYDFPLMAMTGMVSEVDAYYNFNRQSQVLPEGTPISRRFAEDGYELYAQDVW